MLMLILACRFRIEKNVKAFWNLKSYFQIPDISILVKRFHAFTKIYLSLIDFLIDMSQAL